MFVYTGRVHGRVHGRVYMAGTPTRPCTRSQTARYGCVRPVTAVYTAGSQPVHGNVRVRRPLHGRLTRAYVYTAVKRPCTCHVHVLVHASTQSCTWQVGLHGRVHGPRRHVAAVGRAHGRNAPCTRSCTRPIHSPVHVRLHGPCTRVHGTYTAVYTVRSGPYAAVYTASTQPYTRAMYTARTRLCKCSCIRAVYAAVHGPSCTWQVGLPGHVHVLRRHATAVCGPSRPCRRPIHSPFTAVHSPFTAKTCSRAVYTAAV